LNNRFGETLNQIVVLKTTDVPRGLFVAPFILLSIITLTSMELGEGANLIHGLLVVALRFAQNFLFILSANFKKLVLPV
jgi:hypothetical protein